MNLPAGDHPGQLCLHASAVVVGEGLLAFVAPKNQGKSTLSVALADAGALRVSDDNIVVASSRPVTARSGDQLDKLEGTVDFAALRAAKLVPSTAKRAKVVKKGELSKKLVLKGVQATAGARAAIEAAGGSIEE